MILFEYDPAKSASNKDKHGIDFEEAQALWEDFVITLPTDAGSDEARWAVLGMINGKHWTAIVARRNRAVRIISVRRSRKKEEMIYDREKENIPC